jgi:hypothetical protein
LVTSLGLVTGGCFAKIENGARDRGPASESDYIGIFGFGLANINNSSCRFWILFKVSLGVGEELFDGFTFFGRWFAVESKFKGMV